MIGAINLENLFDYLVPIGIMILYFIMTANKKKVPPKAQEEVEEQRLERTPPPSPKRVAQLPGPPPVSRRQEVLRSKIEDRKIDSNVEDTRFSSSLAKVNSSNLVSDEMLKHIDLDPAYAHKTGKKVSHARKLLTSKTSIRHAMLLKEILERPHQ